MKRIEIYIGLSVFALSAKSQVKESRPNVIYIIMDDLGYGDIGCYGSEKIETPNIALHRFTRFGTRPLCVDDRYALGTCANPG